MARTRVWIGLAVGLLFLGIIGLVSCTKLVTQPDGTITKVLDIAKTQPIVNLSLKAGAITLCRYTVKKTDTSEAVLKLAYAMAQKNPQAAYDQLVLLKADPAIASLYGVFNDVLGLVQGATSSDWLTLANSGAQSAILGCAAGLGISLV